MYAYQNPVPVFGQVADPAASKARMWRNIAIGALVVGGVGTVVLAVRGRLFSAAGVAVAGLLGAGAAEGMRAMAE